MGGVAGPTETARAVAEQDRDGARESVGGDEVLLAVAIEIAHRDLERTIGDGEVGRGTEAAHIITQ